MELGLSLTICKVKIIIILLCWVIVRITEVKKLVHSLEIDTGQLNDSYPQTSLPQRWGQILFGPQLEGVRIPFVLSLLLGPSCAVHVARCTVWWEDQSGSERLAHPGFNLFCGLERVTSLLWVSLCSFIRWDCFELLIFKVLGWNHSLVIC